MNKYEIIIYWSDEDNVYIAEVPELLGCMTHGDTRAATLANAEEAIQLWVDTAKEFGNVVPKPKLGRLSGAPTEFRFKRQNQGEGVRLGRRNNPSPIISLGRHQLRMNPKAH